MRHVHRDVVVRNEFEYYLRKWVQKHHADFPILYLGFHGEEGSIYFESSTRSDSIDLDSLENSLRGNCCGRMIHFGSCSTLGLDARRIKRFLRETGLKGVTGYKQEIAWVDSAAFELILLDRLTDAQRGFTKASLAAVERDARSTAGRLARDLGFRMILA